MWKPIDRATAIAVWAFTLATVVACSVWLGAPITASSGVVLLLVCVVPPAVMLTVWQGSPSPPVAEILETDDRRTDV